MHLDPLTLMVPEVIASAISSVFVFGAWLRFRDATALIWWGAAHGAYTVGLAMMLAAFATADPSKIPLGGTMMCSAPVFVWAGARSFFGLPMRWPVITGAPALLSMTALIPVGIDTQAWFGTFGLAMWPVFLTAATYVLVVNRTEPLPARWILSGLLMVHSFVFILALNEIAKGEFAYDKVPTLGSAFGVVHFESILFSMGTALMMILICHERKERRYVQASRCDPLTGSSNRGAFFETAERLLERDRQAAAPCSLIMFDLDRFKAINDTYGHQFGDRVLQEFAETVRQSIRPRDQFGRYGGEEFIVILPGASIETACAIAERVRRVFADSHEFVDGQPVRATVSAGVATADPQMNLNDMVAAADKALYSAKHNGRNRVERAPGPDDAAPSHIVRIA